MAAICGYELPTNSQNFMQKDLTEVKIFQKVLGGYFFETPCTYRKSLSGGRCHSRIWKRISSTCHHSMRTV